MATTYPSSQTYPGTVSPGTSGSAVFTPDLRTMTVLVEGALRYSYQVGSTVWKDSGGVWHEKAVPYDGDLVGSFVLTTGTSVSVDAGTAAELSAAGIGTITEE